MVLTKTRTGVTLKFSSHELHDLLTFVDLPLDVLIKALKESRHEWANRDDHVQTYDVYGLQAQLIKEGTRIEKEMK